MIRGLLWTMAILATSAAGLLALSGDGSHGAGVRLALKAALLLATASLASLVALRWGLGEQRTRTLVSRLGVMAAALFVTLATGEATIRFLLRHVSTTADNTSYFARRWTREAVSLNSHGFREREYEEQAAPGVFRIVIVGDSFTFGQGIRDAERFARVVERALGGRPAGFEVLTFARPGAETVDQLQILKGPALGANPDFVLLQWYANDYQDHSRPRDPEGPRAWPLWPHWTHGLLHGRSALYFLLNQRWMALQRALRPALRRAEDEALAAFAAPDHPERRRYRGVLEEWLSICAKAGVPTGVVLFPHRDADGRIAERYEPLKRLVRDTFVGAEAPVLDLSNAYAPFAGDYLALAVNEFDGHPNALANRIAAEQILAAFGPTWRSLRLSSGSQREVRDGSGQSAPATR